MESRSELGEDAQVVFRHIYRGLLSFNSMIKPVPVCKVSVRAMSHGLANIRKLPGEKRQFLLRVSECFLEEVRDTIDQHRENIKQVAFYKIEGVETENIVQSERFLEVVYDLCLQFIFSHELFHLLLGHCDYLKSECDSSILDETHYRIDNVDSDIDFLFEFEADNTSIIWLFSIIVTESLNKLIEDIGLDTTEDDPAICRLNDRAKIFASRLMVIAIWMVLSILEQRRYDGDRSMAFESHPLPELRIETCLLTLIQHFTKIYETESVNGELLGKVDEHAEEKLNAFMLEVMGPFALYFRDFPNVSSNEESNETFDNFDENNKALKIVQEVRDYLQNDVNRGLLWETMQLLIPKHNQLQNALDEFRYIKEISI